MGFTLSGGALLSFKTKRNNPYLSHSILPVLVNINRDGAFSAAAFMTSYWRDDKIRFYFDGIYRNMDDNYWGIGIDKGFDIDKGSETTLFHAKNLLLSPVLLVCIKGDLFLGVKTRFSQFNATDISSLMQEDADVLNAGTEIRSSGLGFNLEYDSRDFSPNAGHGILLRISGLYFGSFFGSDHEFNSHALDYRQYQNIIREGSTLTWQYSLRITNKDVPWNELSAIGGFNDLPGYYPGQFRDYHMMFARIEYRHKFYKSGSAEISRHGLVYWLGGGTVFNSLKTINKALMSTGFGYRFELQPRMNLRIDFGFSPGSFGLYLGFTEAF